MKNLLLILFLMPLLTYGQRASGVPGDTGKLSLDDPKDIILYIILPVVIVILYFIWKKKSKTDENNKSS
jgi:heme/copper-type cytochrome/quinol oxidase subunit 2